MGQPGPHGGGKDGVVVLYQNSKVAITDGQITVTVNPGTDKEQVVVIDQKTGQVR